MKLDVWDEMMAIENRADDLFRKILGRRARLDHPAYPTVVRGPFMPATDVFRRKEDLIVAVEISAINPKTNVTVAIEGGVLVIRGERKRKEGVKEQDYFRMEISQGSFERRIPLRRGLRTKTYGRSTKREFSRSSCEAPGKRFGGRRPGAGKSQWG